MEKENRFYENTLFVWTLLFIMPPIGIITLWVIKFYNVYLRITLSIFFGLLFLNYLGMQTSFIRAVLLVLIVNLLWLRNIDINKHKINAMHKYNELLNNFEINEMIKNYIIQYDSPTSSYSYLKHFEEEIVKDYPLTTNKFTIGNLEEIYVNTIFKKLDVIKQKSEIDKDLINNYKTNFMMFTKLIIKKSELGSEKLTVYYLWTLLKQISIDYYSVAFLNKYGDLFQNTDLKDLVKKYINIDSLSKDINSKDRIMFTYYLMKYDFKSLDLISCSNKLEIELQKQMKLKKEKEFEMSLKNKEVEVNVSI
ncbi:MAG: hypothetical protein K0Q49_1648 [Haloplasmataceae bacterium]|jgi:hypothetical protein|nr:hypothetical protein [Haloplasmataceae bacterium]